MFLRGIVISLLLFPVSLCAATPRGGASSAALTAAQIVERNVSARGGLDKWRAVESLSISGTMQAGGNNRPSLSSPVPADKTSAPSARPAEQMLLPFVMELKRPLKMRVELEFRGQTAFQIYDGAHGWKLRPFLNRREVEPYTDDEMKTVAIQADLDGPLVDYARKGTGIVLIGKEQVEGHETYRLRLTLKSGHTQDVWIDATTFLETKMEGTPRRLDGQEHRVEVFYRDFRQVDGLQIPFVVETHVLNTPTALQGTATVTATEQIHLNKVQINPTLDDMLFTRASLDAAAANPGVSPTH